MKRILLVCLCIILLLPAGVFAQDVTGSLIQPGVYNAKKGQTLNYSFEINLKEGYQKRLKSFNLSLMMDPNLEVKSVKPRDLKTGQAWRINQSSLNGKDVINFAVDEVNQLGKVQKIVLDITVLVKKDIKGSGSLKNTYVLYFADREGKESSDQKELITTPSKEKGKLIVEDLSSKENVLRGQGPKNTKILLYRGDKVIGETYSSAKGDFEIVINPQVPGTRLRVQALDENKQVLSRDLVVDQKSQGQDPGPVLVEKGLSMEKSQKLKDFLDYSKSLSLKGQSLEQVNRFKAYTAMGDYILVKSSAKDEEADQVIGQLIEAIKEIQPAFMKGKSQKTFAPDDSMTRAEVASVLYQLKGQGANPYFSNFKDVKQEDWYAEAVGFVEGANLMTGTGKNRFEPKRKITKGEFAAIMAKLLPEEERPSFFVQIPRQGDNFKDVKENYWAYDPILTIKNRGIVQGDQNGLFHPQKTMSRAECSTMLIRGIYSPSPLGKEYGTNPYKDLKANHWAYNSILQATGNDMGTSEK